MISIRRSIALALLFAAAIGLATPVLAEDKPADAQGDAAKAQAAAAVCAGCHGAEGISPIPTQPNLAGMPSAYLTKELRHFKSGQRDDAIMKGFAATLSDDDMKLLGAYFSAKPAGTIGSKDLKLAKTAERLYRGGDATRGIPACAGCHSPSGAGIAAQYPRIGGQHAEYTLAQLNNFRSGKRGVASKDDPNANGKMMATIASRLTDAEVKALAEYTAALKAN
ncbi:MAG: c-type cytochrome [Proteobacteria bacterium]|nr:c-type cytochrome [Pseudomonadota bacterium]